MCLAPVIRSSAQRARPEDEGARKLSPGLSPGLSLGLNGTKIRAAWDGSRPSRWDSTPRFQPLTPNTGCLCYNALRRVERSLEIVPFNPGLNPISANYCAKSLLSPSHLSGKVIWRNGIAVEQGAPAQVG
jgi:hypothetical protein